MTRIFLSTKYKIFSIFFFILLFSGYLYSYASIYAPGATLDPDCAPTSANCTVTPISIGGTINSATLGSVMFAGTSGVLAQDNANFFWDDTNNRLGIGTSTPTYKLEVDSSDILIYGIRAGRGPGGISSNTVFGLNSMASVTTGNNNTAFGYNTLNALIDGYWNVAIGVNALTSTTSGYHNIGIGVNALYANTTGQENVALGAGSLRFNVTGNFNTAVGEYSLHSNTGSRNQVLGYYSGYEVTSGTQNTFVGYSTGRGITTGSYNTIIGSSVTGLSASLSNNIIIADGQGNRRINVDSSGDVGIGSDSKLSKLTITAPADTTDIGGTTTANASTTITGVGTTFTTSLGIGDRISLSSAPSTYRTVIAINSDTSLTVDNTIGDGSSQTINLKKSIFRLDDAAGVTKLLVNDQGTLQLGMVGFVPPITSFSGRVLTAYSSNTPATLIHSGSSGQAVLDLFSPNIATSSTQGANLNWQSVNSDGTSTQFANITTFYRNKTAGSERADLSFFTIDSANGMTEKMRITGPGWIGINTTSNLSQFTVKQNTDKTDIGGTTDANASTTITGVGTTFTTSLGIGDRISLSSAPSTYATVTAIASSTSLTVNTALGDGSSQTINLKKSIFRLDDASNVTKFLVQDDGSTAINASIANPLGFGGGSFSFEGKTSNQPGNIIIMGNNLNAGNPVGRLIFGHHYGTTYTRVADIVANQANADDAADLVISTKPTGGSLTARITVSSTGALTLSSLLSCGGLQTNGSGVVSCTSDESLKDIHSHFTKGLDAIRNVNPIAYSWKNNTYLYDNGIIYNGFSAQNIQQALGNDATSLSSDGHLQISQLTILASAINAIKELDLTVIGINGLDNNTEFAGNLRSWFANATNRITRIFTGEICLTDTDGSSECLNKAELYQLKQLLNISQPVSQSSILAPEDNTPTVQDQPLDSEEVVISEEEVVSVPENQEVSEEPVLSETPVN